MPINEKLFEAMEVKRVIIEVIILLLMKIMISVDIMKRFE